MVEKLSGRAVGKPSTASNNDSVLKLYLTYQAGMIKGYCWVGETASIPEIQVQLHTSKHQGSPLKPWEKNGTIGQAVRA